MINKISRAFHPRDIHREDPSLLAAVVTSAKGRPASGVGDNRDTEMYDRRFQQGDAP